MQVWDYLKALGTGALALALNLLTLVLLVFGYSQFVEPGHPQEFYNEAALRLGAYSGPIGGATILFLLISLLSRRRPQRNAYAFAGATFASYFAIDTALGLATTPATELFRLPFLLSMAGACAAALVAAFLATKRT